MEARVGSEIAFWCCCAPERLVFWTGFEVADYRARRVQTGHEILGRILWREGNDWRQRRRTSTKETDLDLGEISSWSVMLSFIAFSGTYSWPPPSLSLSLLSFFLPRPHHGTHSRSFASALLAPSSSLVLLCAFGSLVLLYSKMDLSIPFPSFARSSDEVRCFLQFPCNH